MALELRKCWRRKPIEHICRTAESDAAGPQLRRVLGITELTLMGVSVIVGAGIFVVTGTAAALYAGPAITLSFVLAGLACALCAMCYAELAAMMPVAGSAYSYAYVTLGEGVAWVIGWNLLLEYVFAASYVAVGWSGYFDSILRRVGIALPEHLMTAPLAVTANHLQWAGATVNLPAIGIALLMAAVAFIGIRISTAVNAAIVILKIGVLVLVIVFGISHVDGHLWTPFVPEASASGSFGWTGVLRGSAVVFVSYLGFDAIATAGQETRNPQRALPLAIMGSLAIATILYVIVSLVLTGLVPYAMLNVPNPLSVALTALGPSVSWRVVIVDLAAIVGLASVILVIMLAQPRILLAMGRDGLLPPFFGRVHARFRTPHWGTVISALVVAVLAGCFPIGLLVQLVSVGTLCVFIVVCVGVLVLRQTQPAWPRSFRTPWVPLVPVLGTLVCAYILTGLQARVWHMYGLWLIAGMIVYAFYGHRRSHAVHEDSQ